MKTPEGGLKRRSLDVVGEWEKAGGEAGGEGIRALSGITPDLTRVQEGTDL